MSTNLYTLFRELVPEPALQVGTVQSVANGVADVLLPGGGVIQARGDTTTGTKVFVRNGVIEGTAPSLSIEVIEV